jgi:hypothetical protein
MAGSVEETQCKKEKRMNISYSAADGRDTFVYSARDGRRRIRVRSGIRVSGTNIRVHYA